MIKQRSYKNYIDLDKISDDELLDVRVCDLPIKIQGTWIEGCIGQLYQELDDAGIHFKPQCYLADEWLTPEKETCIGIPFYLAHPALIRLEKKFMMEAEGEGRQWCMKLLRHETGHALCYAYIFHQRKKWQNIFGSADTEYTDTFKYRPYSKNYVRHLDGYYAQYHPDEDFVETFAVWLTPNLDWREKYKNWKAIHKLQYVDQLMQAIKGKIPAYHSSQKFWRLSTLKFNLRTYFKRKRHFWAEEFPDFHDRFLRKNFVQTNQNGSNLKVSEVIRKHRKNILSSVSRYSGEKKYLINEVIKNINKRSQQLKLIVQDDESSVTLHLSSYITSLVMNHSYTGRFRGNEKKIKKI